MPDVFDDTIDPGRRADIDALEQRALDVELLDDRFEDPVGVAQRVRRPCRSRRS